MLESPTTTQSPPRWPAAAAPAPARSEVAPGGWVVLFVLTLVYIVSFIDRGAISLVVGPIKEDLGATDLEISWLLGLSFMLLYSVLGIPAGYLVDLYRRKYLLSGAILMWSGVQMLCGLSNTYWHLFLARIGLGVGEAMLPPAASSMIRDAFPPERRGLAFGIYNIGPLLGSGLALVLGSFLLTFAASGKLAGVPLLETLKPWQFVLIVPGLLGLPLAAVMLLLREPARRDAVAQADRVTYPDALRFAWQQRAVYGPLWIAICLYGIAIGSQLAWLPEIIHRSMGTSRPVIGQTLGAISMVASPLGLLFFGSVADKLQKRGWVDAPVRVAIGSTAVAALITACFPLIHSAQLGAIAYAAQTFFFVVFAVAGGATMANFTPGNMMGKLTALYYLITNLLGLALGPTVCALVARLFFDGENALGHAFVACYVVSVAIAVCLLARVSGSLRAFQK
ncbi:MFS transporter [Cupriavidus taiwanensis]|uniref:MFS transporter n=1 Tax=Cupriavidus taiwanensis TaxID=164546 RepID=UPI0015716046|nr:MFS transporter [Cupriavidus taiwanensis]NSX14700.1 MFS transporter [Cupriavidus taiwanensis]